MRIEMTKKRYMTPSITIEPLDEPLLDSLHMGSIENPNPTEGEAKSNFYGDDMDGFEDEEPSIWSQSEDDWQM